MFGKNPIRKPVKGDGTNLDIQEIFSSIQGEGPNAGMPAVFVRLGGCNLACEFCDTEFESFNPMSLDEIKTEMFSLAKDYIKLAVVTGGEPFRQPIEKLCQTLIEAGFKVQIETNGTLYRELPGEVEIVCSPKNQGRGYSNIRPDLIGRVNALKFIISANDNLYGDIGEVGQSNYSIPVYVQPMDEQDKVKNRKNLEYATELALKNGYKLSIQQHKVIGLR